MTDGGKPCEDCGLIVYMFTNTWGLCRFCWERLFGVGVGVHTKTKTQGEA